MGLPLHVLRAPDTHDDSPRQAGGRTGFAGPSLPGCLSAQYSQSSTSVIAPFGCRAAASVAQQRVLDFFFACVTVPNGHGPGSPRAPGRRRSADETGAGDAVDERLPAAPAAMEQSGAREPEPAEAPAQLRPASPDESGQAEAKLIYRLAGRLRLDTTPGAQRPRQEPPATSVGRTRSSSSAGSLHRQLGLAAAYIHDDFEQQDFTVRRA